MTVRPSNVRRRTGTAVPNARRIRSGALLIGALLVAGVAIAIGAPPASAAPQFRSETWTNTYVDINARAAKTGSRDVTLTLCATHMQAGANAYSYRTSTDGIHWTAWTINVPTFPDWPTQVSYKLTAGAGTKRVYVVYYTTILVASDFNTKASLPSSGTRSSTTRRWPSREARPAAGDGATNASPSRWTGASQRLDATARIRAPTRVTGPEDRSMTDSRKPRDVQAAVSGAPTGFVGGSRLRIGGVGSPPFAWVARLRRLRAAGVMSQQGPVRDRPLLRYDSASC